MCKKFIYIYQMHDAQMWGRVGTTYFIKINDLFSNGGRRLPCI
ncbi:hypothetical protein CLV88_103172 [Shimia abyssi]|uniref:Uncharacterized protein n=1 Tax=Shimia abyssi TaxID=1662395 RepID=A0A2P8FFM9_9RHOB|nr:hypothetical protein CLV88_103172 [Shimia abyssi]